MVNAYGQSSAKMIIDYFVQKFSVCRSFWTDKNALYGFLLVKLLSFKLLLLFWFLPEVLRDWRIPALAQNASFF